MTKSSGKLGKDIAADLKPCPRQDIHESHAWTDARLLGLDGQPAAKYHHCPGIDRSVLQKKTALRVSNGGTVVLCVLHELNRETHVTAEAITVVGGMSVCREHLKPVVDALVRQVPPDYILLSARIGDL